MGLPGLTWAYLCPTTWTTWTTGGGGSLAGLCSLPPASAPRRRGTQEGTGGQGAGAQQPRAELASGDSSKGSAGSPRREPSPHALVARARTRAPRWLSGPDAEGRRD